MELEFGFLRIIISRIAQFHSRYIEFIENNDKFIVQDKYVNLPLIRH